MVTAEGYAKAGVPYRVDRPSFLILRVFFPSHGNLYGKENPRLKGRRQFLCAQTRRFLTGMLFPSLDACLMLPPPADASPATGDPGSPASRDPFPQIPAFEGRCIPAGFVARPHRTAAGTPRPGASPDGAHRPSRCTASLGTDLWRPGGPLGYARDLRPLAAIPLDAIFSFRRDTPQRTTRDRNVPLWNVPL